MKPIKKHYDFLPSIYVPIFVIAILLVILVPQKIIICFAIHGLIFLLLLILACTPFAKLKLGNYQPMSFAKWLGLLLMVSLAINFIYLGLISVVEKLPVSYSFYSNSLLNTSNTFIFKWFGFPWMIFFTVGIFLAYVSFFQHKTGQLSATLQPLLKNKIEDATSLTTDFFVRTVAHFSLAMMIGIITLHTIGILSHHFQVPIFSQLRFATLLIATVFLVLMNLQQWRDSIRFLIAKNIPIALIAVIFIVVISVAFIILNYLINLAANTFPQWGQLIIQFKYNWQTIWLLLSGMWWLAWLPLFSGLIAAISKGFTIRKMILGGIIVLLVNSSFLFLLPYFKHLKTTWEIITLILPYVGFVIIAGLFMQKKYLTYALRGIVPLSKEEKTRSMIYFTQNLLQVALFVLIFYFPLGIYLVNFLVFIMIFPLAVLSMISVVGFFWVMLKKLSSRTS